MRQLLRYFWVSAVLILAALTADAQSVQTHKVKKGETIYGIAHANGITESQLRSANPGMESPDYVLKKGSKIIIPAPLPATSAESVADADGDVRLRAIRMGVMLPLHDLNGDGRRMVEYYRGLLMACDSLKHEGISVNVYAWNTPENGDIADVLVKAGEAKCDLIFGPLYSKQMEQLAAFCQQYGTMLVVPFSIQAPQLLSNRHIFQIYQSAENLNDVTAQRAVEWFKNSHPVIVDCDDPNSTKGMFTSVLRKQLEKAGISYNLTSLKSANASFASAFSIKKPNVVVLNSSRTSDLDVIFIKLKDMVAANPDMKVSLLGYAEWMALPETYQEKFHKYDFYIPATAFAGLAPYLSQKLSQQYRTDFHQSMSSFYPPLAMTGFDHATFFLRGLHKYGATFDGASGRFGYQPVQAPLKFEKVGSNGGYQNRTFMFVHYKTDGKVETISY